MLHVKKNALEIQGQEKQLKSFTQMQAKQQFGYAYVIEIVPKLRSSASKETFVHLKTSRCISFKTDAFPTLNLAVPRDQTQTCLVEEQIKLSIQLTV